MAKHAAPRTRSSLRRRLLIGGLTVTAGVLSAALVTGMVERATVQGTAHSATINADEPGRDCHTMGNHVCGPQPAACWVEKTGSVYAAEMICGDPALRPRTDTADIGQVFGDDHGYGCGWVVTGVPSEDIDGGLEYDPEPAGCN